MAELNRASKTVQFISKLVQLTQDRKINWDVAGKQGESAAFTATVEGRKIRIFRHTEQRPLEVGTTGTGLGGLLGVIPRQTIRKVGLEVLDEAGRTAYSFEDVTGLSDLYESASFSASKVAELMDSVLARK